MKWTARVAVAAFAMAVIGIASAQTGETPLTFEGARTVSSAEAKGLMDKGAVVFDVRRKAAYVEGHLPGAKSIRKNEATGAFDPTVFGASKDAPVVIYGHGTDGWSAFDAVKAAVGAGFKNVNWMRGGWSDWNKAGLPIED